MCKALTKPDAENCSDSRMLDAELQGFVKVSEDKMRERQTCGGVFVPPQVP